ncbi:MAG: mannose-1-phosphate guanylyltransferase [Ignavibacteriales bacterium CG07_land_8_20_14_0_80_59_12]|nr:MAG: mannose-1-phosphate guanylyltransferase [Ignavibacteriales bacterium CG07_land_8_20_14_0_80_59_12]
MPELYAVIMAGGVGARFWPTSRERMPKQLLKIIGKESLLQSTFDRIGSLVPPERTFVVTNESQLESVLAQLPQIPRANFLVEPVGRNTAPCIGLAALHVKRLNPAGVMVVLPADHRIEDEPLFHRAIETAARVADESAALVTIGIHPTRPETGYGYIQILDEGEVGNRPVGKDIYRVKTFAEKPNLATAQKFLESGDFLWNSGMFVWRADVILEQINRHLPDLAQGLATVEPSIGTHGYEETVDTVYGLIRSVSIDYGVMEKADRVFVIKAAFNWNDIGSWDEVYRLLPKDEDGNAVDGLVIAKGTSRSLIHSSGRLVATVGVSDVIVIETPDAVLVCKRMHSQDVKEVVDTIRRKQLSDYL